MATLPATVALTLKRFSEAGGVLVTDAGVLSDERLMETIAKARVAPEARIEGDTGGRDEVPGLVRSRDDHRHQPRRCGAACHHDVRARRPGSDLAEHEDCAAVNFIAGPDGPRYTYNFGPRDAFVLMIRKTIR